MKMIVLSKGRSETIKEKTLRLFPDAYVCVAESEKVDYAMVTDKIITHPDNISGIGPLRNWVVANIEDETIVMLDDDISCVYDQVSYNKSRIEDPTHCMAILERTAIIAKEAQCYLFGFSQCSLPLNFNILSPFIFNTWVGGVVGVIGKRQGWDNGLILRADIDACLRSMVKERILWIDNRYIFVHDRFKNKGGNNINRTKEQHELEIKVLKNRWGNTIKRKDLKGTIRLSLNIKR